MSMSGIGDGPDAAAGRRELGGGWSRFRSGERRTESGNELVQGCPQRRTRGLSRFVGPKNDNPSCGLRAGRERSAGGGNLHTGVFDDFVLRDGVLSFCSV